MSAFDSTRSVLTGVGAYGRYKVATPFAVALRYERLADEGLFGRCRADPPRNHAHRRAPPFAGGFLVRASIEDGDSSSEPFLSGPLGTADLRRTQPTALIGAIWVFGSKDGTVISASRSSFHTAVLHRHGRAVWACERDRVRRV